MALDRVALVPAICKRLATGEPLAVICRDLGIGRRTVQLWRKNDPAIDEQMQDARDDGYDAIAAGCLEIADDARNDYMAAVGEDESVVYRLNGEHIQRSKLRVDTRLKLLAKWDPKRYGDALKLSGDPEAPLAGLTDEQVDARLEVLLAKREASV